MSLQFWYPFTTDGRNQGLYNAGLSSSVALNNNGKLGKCLELTNYLDLNVPNSIYNVYSLTDTEISYSLWFKIDKTYLNTLISNTDFSSKTQMFNRIIGLDIGTTSSGVGLALCTVSGLTSSTVLDTVLIYAYLRNGSQSKSTPTVTINLDQWYHCAITYDINNNLRFYLDGILMSDQETIRATLNSGVTSRKVYLNTNKTIKTNADAANIHLVFLKEYFNDVRIYDHALSAKEVEEIAKGLVLHYKLDDTSNPNILRSNYRSHNSTAYLAYQLNLSENLTANTTYTMQLWDVDIAHSGKTAAQLGLGIYWGGGNVHLKSFLGTNYFTNGHADYLCFQITPTTAQSQHANASNAWLNIYNSPSDKSGTRSFSIGRWKLEKGTTATPIGVFDNTVYDSSGYSNNGIISGTLTAAAGSPRYGCATVFPTVSDYFDFPHLVDSTAMTNEFTFSCWLYRDYTDATQRYLYYGLCTIYLYTDFKPRISWQHASADLSTNSGNTWAPSVAAIPAQTWTHLVFTFKDGILYCYINGTKYGPSDRSANGQFIRGTRGSPNASIGYSWIGRISDIRTYATALTEAQVKELYNTSMSIDSNGNVYARELVEL